MSDFKHVKYKRQNVTVYVLIRIYGLLDLPAGDSHEISSLSGSHRGGIPDNPHLRVTHILPTRPV